MASYDVEVTQWFDEHIHDQKHFTSRFARKISNITGCEVDLLVKVSVIAYITLLLFSPEAHYLSNFVLIAIPILVTFVFPDEKPSNTRLFLHWTFFGISILFDRILEFLPFYHVLKLALFMALYLPPSNPLIAKIEGAVEKLKID